MLSVAPNTAYSEFRSEMRRYRDYELASAGWFSGLQLGVTTLMLVAVKEIWNAEKLPQSVGFLFIAIAIVIGSCGAFSVSYAKQRYEQLSKIHRDNFEDLLQLPEHRMLTEPSYSILLSLLAFPVGNVFLIGKILKWGCCGCCLGAAFAPG